MCSTCPQKIIGYAFSLVSCNQKIIDLFFWTGTVYYQEAIY
jgi:hypothetical protein